MSDEKMVKYTPEEWHEMAAKALAKENEKVIDRFLESMGESTRDMFAAAALSGMLPNINFDSYRHIAIEAYRYADAMMEERGL